MATTPSQRREAHLADRDISIAIQLGESAAVAMVETSIARCINRFVATKSRGEFMHTVRALLPAAIQAALLPAMVYARLAAWKRVPSVPDVDDELPIAFDRQSNVGGAIDFLRKRLGFPVAKLRRMADAMNAPVLTIAKDASATVEKRLQRAFMDMTKRNVHVREGVELLRREFDAAGLTGANKHQIATVFRTQTMLAYAAGEQEIDQSPEIDEILWGYTYVTVGDDRVRPAHAALDGVTLPKDDPFWDKNRPPNDWNCRCRLIRVFDPERKVRPPKQIRVNDKVVVPGAAEGFRFSPLDLVRQ